MLIREATEFDIPKILEVLKASLGEISSKKTEAVWRYKHIDNPFGKSLVLVAVDNHQIIGVRALMRWKWQLKNQVFSALRAVDTATHPEHQGKGVFKKLTLEAIKIAKLNGDHLIFNTPNTQSKPGYLKMGWEEVDRIKIRATPSNPLYWFRDKEIDYKAKSEKNLIIKDSELFRVYNNLQTKTEKLFTLKSAEYLEWRYKNNPLQKYFFKYDNDFYFSGYIKEHKYFKELRVTEHIYVDKIGYSKIQKQIRNISKEFGAHIITSSFQWIDTLSLSGGYGPTLTIRNLNLAPAFETQLLDLKKWSYTLGDLELF